VITIPTGELTGLLSDVLVFAFPEDDLPHVNCVRIEWDGEMLHAEATDTLHAARSSWHPDDIDGNDSQPSLHNPLGGDDDRWVVIAVPRLPRSRLGPNDIADCPSRSCMVWHQAHGYDHDCRRGVPVRSRLTRRPLRDLPETRRFPQALPEEVA
jgi:hypothetical protein